ncbi:hypothetical protein PBRA_005600 [Plasmodiophora brassicae]|uniref:Uncharacterized protein n=1 Tax=Plasmodiophora brassicae TaxID=37360 RepID=A0A0G4IP18_PLABS|nr:hypothetical protein PBRA_005600 [Plasmodiophora brassicae]
MGACLSSTYNEEFRGSVVLSSILDRERKDAASQYVILFLGTGESGKSTFFKQLKIIHGGGIDKGDRAAIRACIRTMIISDVMTLIRGCLLPNMAGLIGQDVKVSQDIIDMLCGAELSPQTVKQAIIGASPDDNYLSPIAGDLIHAIWNDPIVKKVYDNRRMFHLGDHVSYFFDKIKTIASSDWEPTQDDCVHARQKTTGVVEQMLVDPKTQTTLRCVDVGGQRSERRKWVGLFSQATCIAFVVGISEYDQTCAEDGETLRSVESFNVFKSVCREEQLKKAGLVANVVLAYSGGLTVLLCRIVVFFNKLDLLRQKLATVPFGPPYVTDFNGSGSAESVGRYFRDKYQAEATLAFREIGEPSRLVRFFLTTAVDRENVNKVFESVIEIVIRISLNKCDLC